MEIQIWISIYGYPYIDIHIWISIYGYPCMDIHIWISMRPLFGLAGRVRMDARGSSMGSGLNFARVWCTKPRPLYGLAGRVQIDARRSPISSGLSSRSGLVHTSAPAIGFGWTGSHRCSRGAGGLWTDLSLGFGAQKRARYRGRREGFESSLGGRHCALILILLRVWRTKARPL